MVLPVAERVSAGRMPADPGSALFICMIIPAMYEEKRKSFGVGWTNEAANFFGVQLYESKRDAL